ncbi:MAG: hypothetical protein ACOYB1_11885 [Limnohabitans sp.]
MTSALMRKAEPHTQRGAITLLVSITLVLLATLTSLYSTQSIFIDRLASHAQIQATHARLAAEAALAWSQAEIQRIAQTSSASNFWAATPPAACPAQLSGRQWQCVRMQVPALLPAQVLSAEVLAMRDVVNAPHVTQLQARSVLSDQRSRAQVNQSLYMPTALPTPAQASTAAVVLSKGTDTGLPCAPSAWQQVLGDLSREHIQSWSQAQERQGLTAQTQPPRSIYWIDNPTVWTQSLGTPQAPVLIVFSANACTPRCPDMVSGVQIHGTVVLDTRCQDDKVRTWRAGLIEGQLLIESDWPDMPTDSPIWARPYARQAYLLPWPQGMDARQVQRISGSWHEGTP